MSLLVVNVPINISGVTPETKGKLLPAFAATGIPEFIETGKAESGVCWNDFGASDANYGVISSLESGEMQDGLKDLGYYAKNPEFEKWAQGFLADLEADGSVDYSKRDVQICDECEAPQALEGVELTRCDCSYCGLALSVHIDSKYVLSLDLPQKPEDLIDKVEVYNPPTNWRGQLVTLPSSILISKKRTEGIEIPSSDGLVIDAKVLNILLTLYMGLEKGSDKVSHLLGRPHMNKLVPYTHILRRKDDIPKLHYIGMSKMPLEAILESCEKANIQFSPGIIYRLVGILAIGNRNWDNENGVHEATSHLRKASRHMDFGHIREIVSKSLAAKTARPR